MEINLSPKKKCGSLLKNAKGIDEKIKDQVSVLKQIGVWNLNRSTDYVLKSLASTFRQN